MLPAFTVGFQKVNKSCLFLLVALPGLTGTLLHSCQLQGSCYDCLCRGDTGTCHRKIQKTFCSVGSLYSEKK